MAEFVENRKVLYIDDEDNLLSSSRSLMRNQNMEVFTLSDPLKTVDVLESSRPVCRRPFGRKDAGAGRGRHSGIRQKYPPRYSKGQW